MPHYWLPAALIHPSRLPYPSIHIIVPASPLTLLSTTLSETLFSSMPTPTVPNSVLRPRPHVPGSCSSADSPTVPRMPPPPPGIATSGRIPTATTIACRKNWCHWRPQSSAMDVVRRFESGVKSAGGWHRIVNSTSAAMQGAPQGLTKPALSAMSMPTRQHGPRP
ncbi:hypothetical protein BV25DRAFT_1922478 [Artomyces pyxidatus]|uniref:Uncharacterized protein n=1 Tax=Artomyces pyxidatus TaxID=48021 RepID=A0ACB8SER2_9AGAM|nr:hypothetical protein BV25DRAFT_1922478 [Artomyces pyxidatus]